MFKKLLVALKKDDYNDVYREISSHTHNIMTKLSLIGRSLDIENSCDLKNISSRLDEVAYTSKETSKVTIEKLEALQTSFSQPVFDRRGSTPVSLVSIADSLSRLEQHFLGSAHGSASSAGGNFAFGSSSEMRHQARQDSYSPSNTRSISAIQQIGTDYDNQQRYMSSNALGTQKARLEVNGNLEDMAQNWTEGELEARRRLVLFERSLLGSVITATFRPVEINERPPNSICVSCIYWDDKGECFVTSVDILYLFEQLVATRFTVEEKNRIRRNLEGFRPQTVSKLNPDTGGFFRTIMNFPAPKPRNIEKYAKVFRWQDLGPILKKIVGKHSSANESPHFARYQHSHHGYPNSFPSNPGSLTGPRRPVALLSGSSPADEAQRQSLCAPVTYTELKGRQQSASRLISSDFLPGQKRKRDTEPNQPWRSLDLKRMGDLYDSRGVKKLKLEEEELFDSTPAAQSFPIRSKEFDAQFFIMENDLVNSYIKLIHETTSLRSQRIMLENMPCCFPKIEDESRDQLQEKMDADLRNATEKMQELRKICWREGYSVDDIDFFINSSLRDLPTNELGDDAASSISPTAPTEASLHGIIPESTRRIEAGAWLKKRDRINFWMLAHLRASKEQLQ